MTIRRGLALGLAAVWVSAAVGACGSAPQPQTASASSPSWAASVVSAPVRTAHTKLGAVGYRVVGSGPPLVLIMGYGGTMQAWDPRFVDTLAQHYRVVIFDNAGIGNTQARPAPLTIDAMADQASALIGTLRLGQPDVLGWSMGGMIAQALAVRHPAQVHRLVLCATYPGTSTEVPSQAAIQALSSGNPQQVTADLFPADQAMAADAFTAGTADYPAAASPSAATIAAQGDAVTQWWDGADPAGRETATIAVPALVADGTADRLDPVANARTLATRIPGARLMLYPDAGHAFLFQEGTPFTFLIESFLGGPPKPLSVSGMRARFLAGEAAVIPAGTTWDAKLKALPSDSAALAVAMIDQPYASTLIKFDNQLLSFGATGVVGAAVTTVADAEQHVIDDVTALSVQGSSMLGTWKTTTARDARQAQAATAALRKALGLPAGRAG